MLGGHKRINRITYPRTGFLLALLSWPLPQHFRNLGLLHRQERFPSIFLQKLRQPTLPFAQRRQFSLRWFVLRFTRIVPQQKLRLVQKSIMLGILTRNRREQRRSVSRLSFLAKFFPQGPQSLPKFIMREFIQ